MLREYQRETDHFKGHESFLREAFLELFEELTEQLKVKGNETEWFMKKTE